MWHAARLPRRKSSALGWFLLVLALLGLAFGVFEYTVYSRNKDVLEWNEGWGAGTPEDRDLVAFQFRATVIGLAFGIGMLIAGVALLSSTSSYNRGLERGNLESEVAPVMRVPSAPSGSKVFCAYCGSPLTYGSTYCRICGRRSQ